MRTLHSPRAALLAGICATLAACGGDSTAPKVPEITLDTVLNEVGSAANYAVAGLSLGGGVASTVVVPRADACPYNSSNKRFECPATTSSGITITMYYQLLDASDNALASFDAKKVAAVHTVSDVSGTIASPAGSPTSAITLSGHSDGTISGLLTTTHTLSSTGTSTESFTISGQTFNIATSQTTNLQFLKTGSPNQYPKGTMAMDITSSGGGMPTSTAHVTMTFNGTSMMTMTFSGGGLTETCTVDLAKPSAAPSCK